MPGNLYIDPEGVKRGYYVYAHRDSATGDVFYVGKGCGRRAWKTESRNDKWKKKVASLPKGWDVEIIKDDLSEIEALQLEAELFRQYSGADGDWGALTNLEPGGEAPFSIQIGVQTTDPAWAAAYYDARKFKDFQRDELEAILRDFFDSKLHEVLCEFDDLENEAFDNDDEELDDGLSDLGIILGSLRDEYDDFLRRRISWKDLALGFEDAVDQLEFEDPEELHKRVKPLLKRALKITSGFLKEIDLGNRKDAEEIADRAKSNK